LASKIYNGGNMKLIVSWDTYSWIKYCSGLILQGRDKEFDVVIVCEDTEPSCNFDGLCEEAIYAQRNYDLFRIGKELGGRKMMNMQYKSENDLERVLAQIQLQIFFSNISEVYFENKYSLVKFFIKLTETIGTYCMTFGETTINYLVKAEVYLTDKEFEKKNSLKELMTCIHDKNEVSDFSKKEIFY